LLETARRVFGWDTTTIPSRTRTWRAAKPSLLMLPLEQQLQDYL